MVNGNGRISASGGNGFGGGGGGRVSIDIYSRHDDPKIFVHGGRSFGCPENSGAAGTFYDAVPRSLIVSNHNMSTNTDTLLLEFPNQPLWTNVYVRNNAKAAVPLLWSRVQVQGQLSLLCGGVLSFGLAHYPSSEFELMAEELLMSDSVIKVYGALRMSVKMLLMWNSKMVIDGGGDAMVATSLLESSNLIVLKESSVIHSNANLGVHGQGLLNLSGPGNQIEAQRLILSLFYSIHMQRLRIERKNHETFCYSFNVTWRNWAAVARCSSTKNRVVASWALPPEGSLKLNFDGSSQGNPGPSGMGGVARIGEIVLFYLGPLGIGGSVRAELLDAVQGVQFANQLGVEQLLIEGDSKVVVSWLKTQKLLCGTYKNEVKKFR